MSVNQRWLSASVLLAVAALPASAATPSAKDALKLSPVQKDVEFDAPAEAESARCTIKAEKIDGETAWMVRDAGGQILRRFSDTNNDNVVDLWCYYFHGLEVYRDIDANYNGKADQSRWLNTAGTRWGNDTNEDGQIDNWQIISAEEVSAEAVAALAARDAARFARLLLADKELEALGLGSAKAKQISEKLSAAPRAFAEIAKSDKSLPASAKWMQFGGSRPGLVPKGSDGSTADLLVYENSVAIAETGAQPTQLNLGTIVQAGDAWRLIDAPQIGDGDSSGDSVFFNVPQGDRQNPTLAAGAGSAGLQKLLAQLDTLDKSVATNPETGETPEFHAKRADLLEAVVAEATAEEREQWVRQLADTVSAAVQSGQYPDGAARLLKITEQLKQDPQQADLVGYVQFRSLTAGYGLSLQDPQANFEKVQAAWLDGLKKFVADFPTSSDTPEAMLQLGIAEEFAGAEDAAIAWYDKIVQIFPQAPSARKAAGAKVRLTCVGKSLPLRGPTIDGQQVDVSRLRGKVLLVHYWASSSEPSKTDLAQLKELFGKFGKAGFALVGVSLDNQREELADYLTENPLPWPQVFEPGGLESRLATEMGILTLPTMILVDDKGQVVNRNIHVSEVEIELRKRLKAETTRRPQPATPAPGVRRK